MLNEQMTTIMKKATLILLTALLAVAGYAQTEPAAGGATLKYGYLSYDSVLVTMPQYAQVQTEMAQLHASYEAEMQRVENDFNKKYEEFLDGQKNFPKTILQKRQSELQEMLDKNIAFKKESLKMLNDTEAMMLEAVRNQIDIAVGVVAQDRGYCFVINTDVKATPWLNPQQGEDITELVKEIVKD